MKPRLLLTAIFLGSLIVGPDTAAAAGVTIDGPTFATGASYCGSGAFTLTGGLIVTGGTGAFTTGGCVVTMADRSSLSMEAVTLTGSGSFSTFEGERAKNVFDDAQMTMGLDITLEPGHNPSVLDGNPGGSVVVTNGSTLHAGDSFYATASCNYGGGAVTVKNSTIEADGSDLVLAGSCNGYPGGKVNVTGNTLSAPNSTGGGFAIFSGVKGKVKAIGNLFTFTPGTAYIFADGKCTSKNNTPDVPCT